MNWTVWWKNIIPLRQRVVDCDGLLESSTEGREAPFAFYYGLRHGSPAWSHQHHCLQPVWTLFVELPCFWWQKGKWIVGVPVRPTWGMTGQERSFSLGKPEPQLLKSYSPATSCLYLQTLFLQNPPVSCSPESWLPPSQVSFPSSNHFITLTYAE